MKHFQFRDVPQGATSFYKEEGQSPYKRWHLGERPPIFLFIKK
jgi:hypothetical protein